jgi:hypothetical protein
MNIKFPRWLLPAALALVAGVGALFAAESPKEDAAVSAKLLSAIENSDYKAFLADGDAAFQQLKQEQFDSLAAKLAPKLKSGYAVSYLGELKQRGYRVTLWKVSFTAGGDDALATLSMKDGKVGGFFIR